MKKAAVLSRLQSERLIALVHVEHAAGLIGLAHALANGGIHSLELSLTTPAAIQWLETAAAALPDFHFGLGTVLDVETARLGILAGASFIVTPAPRPEVVTLCRRYNLPIFYGAYTSADLAAAAAAGADAAKVFPGKLFGPMHIQAVKTEFPSVPVIATGGVTPQTVAEFLRVGALAAAAGSSLIDPAALQAGDWSSITRRAGEFVAAVATVAQPVVA